MLKTLNSRRAQLGKWLHNKTGHNFKTNTHFYRIREEGGSGRPPTVHLRTNDVT